MAECWRVVAPFGERAIGETINDADEAADAPHGAVVRVSEPEPELPVKREEA